MGLSRMAVLSINVAVFGILAFVFGIIAENKKPAFGTPIQGKELVICRFPKDTSTAYGLLSVACLAISSVTGLLGVFHPYQGKFVPASALIRSRTLVAFFLQAMAFTVVTGGLMMWATITEAFHITHIIHRDLETQCPTAKTGLFGGAGLLALDSTIFWLISLMLAGNARADYLDEDDLDVAYGQVSAAEYDVHGASHPAA